MELISDYMRDEEHRHLLNDLTRKTFGFDFESWVTQGYYEGEYIPYSLLDEGRIISNVSANRMRFIQNGTEKLYIQLGTVMTDEDCRNKGLAAQLIKHVVEEYEQKCDGIYLFGNLDALGFYQKMGFGNICEYRYSVKEEFCKGAGSNGSFRPVKSLGDEMIKKYLDTVRSCVDRSAFAQTNKYGLQMFYTAGLDNVFYAGDIDCFIVLDEDDGAVLQSVLCKGDIRLADVLDRMEIAGGKCRLGFTPLHEDLGLCNVEKYDGADDYRLFYRGEKLRSIEQERLYFPELSHA